jgi:hypothetical protein
MHLPEKKGQEQGADMGTVNIGIGHYYDLMVSQLFNIKIIFADAGAQGRDDLLDILT